MPWRVANGDAMRRMLRAVGKRRLSRDVLAHRHRLGARQVLEYFFPAGSPMGHAVGQYFILRFCQPRHLAALALLETLPSEEKPILDIACGLGHLEHYLASRERPAPVVGTDMNFFHVWIARHWFAPSAMFVCANAGEGLPFADDAFSASLCSDAYHYIPNRRDLLKHIERCAPGRPVFMTRVGNQAVMPNEGSEQSLQGYLEECGAQARSSVEAFGEGELLKAYLAGRNPLARAEAIPAGLDGEKWLSFSWNLDGAMRGAAPDQRVRPHAVGRIGINPIYRVSGRGKGKMRLRFEFPLPWYAYENHQMLSYHPRSAELPESDEGGLAPGRDWRGDAALAKLVDAYVLIGMPERFGPTPGSPA